MLSRIPRKREGSFTTKNIHLAMNLRLLLHHLLPLSLVLVAVSSSATKSNTPHRIRNKVRRLNYFSEESKKPVGYRNNNYHERKYRSKKGNVRKHGRNFNAKRQETNDSSKKKRILAKYDWNRVLAHARTTMGRGYGLRGKGNAHGSK